LIHFLPEESQGAEESYLTLMLAKFIAQIDLVFELKFKTMNVTEQSIMLSSYASGEILSARQKADNGRPKGDIIGK